MISLIPKILFYAYYIVATLVIVSGLQLSLWRLYYKYTFPTTNEVPIVLDKRSWLHKLRLYLSEWANTAAHGLLWPCAYPPERPPLHKEVRFWIFINLFVLIVILAGRFFPAAAGYVSTFLTISLWAANSQLLYYVIYPISVPEKLKREPGSPYLTFLLLFSSVCTAIVMMLFGLRAPHEEMQMNQVWGLLRNIIQDLLPFTNLRILVSRQWHNFFRLEVACSALLFLVFLRTVLRPAEFKRTDEDIKNIAHTYLQRGSFHDASMQLAQVKQKDAEYFLLMIPALLGIGEREKAAAFGQQLVSMRAHITFDFVLFPDMIEAAIWTYPIPKLEIFHYITNLLQSDNNDEKIANLLFSLLGAKRINNKDVSEFFDERQPDKNRFPLSVSLDLFRRGLRADGMLILQNTVFDRPFAEVFHRVLLLHGQLMELNGHSRNEIVSGWYQEHFADMLNAAAKATTEEEILCVVHSLSTIAKILGTALSVDQIKPIDDMIDLLASRTNQTTEYLKAFLDVTRAKRTFSYRLKHELRALD